MAALLMDLADVGGNVKDGCHIASMGGTWMMLAYGWPACGTTTGRCRSGHVAHRRTTPRFDFP
jgi:Trehalose and maltose hydrolases (possible phosphorylases)